MPAMTLGEALTAIEQVCIDAAYADGKRCYIKAFGTHGPTLKPHRFRKPCNPYRDEVLREAWERGWQGDVRRLIAAE